MVFFRPFSMENEPFLHDFPMISMAEEGWRRSMGLRQHGEAQQWRHHETTMKSHYLPSIYHRKWGWRVFFHSIQCHENTITVSFAIKLPFKHHILRWGTSPEDIPFLDDEPVKNPLDSAFWSTKILGQRSWIQVILRCLRRPATGAIASWRWILRFSQRKIPKHGSALGISKRSPAVEYWAGYIKGGLNVVYTPIYCN